MTTPRQTKAAALLRALLEGRQVSLNGQIYKLRQAKDHGRATFELGLLVLPEKDSAPEFLRTAATLGEFILLADSMSEADFDLIAVPAPEPELPDSAIFKKRRIQV